MSVDFSNLVAILLMAFATYFTRVIGYWLLKDRDLSPRTKRLLETAPGCVLIAVIAPYFMSGKVTDIIALIITAFMASRFSLLPTVVVAIASTAILRSI